MTTENQSFEDEPMETDDQQGDHFASEEQEPETQGSEPLIAELGDEGQGDLAPEDL